jgi:hypothetical protein
MRMGKDSETSDIHAVKRYISVHIAIFAHLAPYSEPLLVGILYMYVCVNIVGQHEATTTWLGVLETAFVDFNGIWNLLL